MIFYEYVVNLQAMLPAPKGHEKSAAQPQSAEPMAAVTCPGS